MSTDSFSNERTSTRIQYHLRPGGWVSVLLEGAAKEQSSLYLFSGTHSAPAPASRQPLRGSRLFGDKVTQECASAILSPAWCFSTDEKEAHLFSEHNCKGFEAAFHQRCWRSFIGRLQNPAKSLPFPLQRGIKMNEHPRKLT